MELGEASSTPSDQIKAEKLEELLDALSEIVPKNDN
jgi:hypothetical protein